MRRALSAMALQAPGEVESRDKVYFPLQSPQPLAAYYAPFPGYGPYLGAAEDHVQPFPPLSASQAVAPLNPFGAAPPLLSPGLAEPLCSVPWYNKLSPWYPLPHFPREMPPLVGSGRAGSRDVVPVANSSHGGLQWGPETLVLPPPSHLIPAPQLLNGEEKLPGGRRFDFTEEDLRFVLYGVVTNLEHPARLQHAVSGVLVPSDCSGLCLMQTMLGEAPHLGVFCCNFIAKGIRFGPFQGKVVNTSEVKTHRDNSRMWEVFEGGHLSHFIDGKGSGNWMSYVNCARFPEEQNLLAVQFQGQIFYESCKEVHENQELLVWYGNCYEKFLDIPMNLQIMERGKQLSGPSDESAEGYRCERCGKVFTYSYYRDKHLKYTPCVDKGDRKFPCSLCKRSFEKRDRLRIHILHVHEKHRPYLCSICGKCFSQSSSLNKHMRVHSGDRPYQCVYCTKKFTASSILRTHIRQHSGEKPFKCKYCGKSFASHAAHDSHVRRSHKEDDCLTCSMCGKSFLDQEDFYSHMKFHKDC